MDIVDQAGTLLPLDLIRLDEVQEPFRSCILGEGKLLFER